MEQRYIGQGWYPDSLKADKDKITLAIIRNEGKEIVIDYLYQRKELFIELKSKDGIFYEGYYSEGHYGESKEELGLIGSCTFELSKNGEKCILDGGYASQQEGMGSWHIELEPESNQRT
ncbi:hypothetical protein ACFL2G_03835 [Candidatus Omnitrophota bacterium]